MLYNYYTMNNSPKQVPSTPDEARDATPIEASSPVKKIAMIGTLIGAALVQAGCEPPTKAPRRNPQVATAKETELKPKKSNMESMGNIDGFGIVTSTEEVLGYGKDQTATGKTYEPPKVEGGVKRSDTNGFSF